VTVTNESYFVEYTGSGTGPYTVPFKIITYTDLKVVKKLIASPYTETTLSYTTDWTVAIGTDASQTSAVTLVSSLSSSYKLIICINTPLKQNSSFRSQRDRDAATDENTHDTCRNVDKRLKRMIDGALRLSDSENPSSFSLQLPPSSDRANSVLGFDGNGNTTIYEIGDGLQLVQYSDSIPQSLGTANAGASNTASRGDHVHPAITVTAVAPITGGGNTGSDFSIGVSNATTSNAGVVVLAADGNTSANTAVQGNDSRLTAKTLSVTAPITGGGNTQSNTTIGVSNATTSNTGVVILAADGNTSANTAVQGSDSRLLPKYVFCCPAAVANTTVFPVIPCEIGAVTTANCSLQNAAVGSALNATVQLVHLGNMAVASNFATISFNANATSCNTGFNSTSTNTAVGMTIVVTAVGNTTAGTNLTVKVK
jgi:hypothetical protein